MQKLKTFVTSFMLVAMAFGPLSLVHAEDAVIIPSDETTIETPAVDPYDQMLEELATLKKQEKSPLTGGFSRFFLRLKIRQLENQLNLKKALE